jgi:hypothetical protein
MSLGQAWAHIILSHSVAMDARAHSCRKDYAISKGIPFEIGFDAMVAFPLLLIPLAIFNIIVFLMPGLSLTSPVTSLTLKSGAIWGVTAGDVLLAVAALLLLIEMVKAARPGGKSIVELLLSILLCGGAIAEFVMLAPFGTSVFFLLIVMALVDVIGSLAVSMQSRRRVVRQVVATPMAAPAPPRAIEPVIIPPAPVSPVELRPEPTVTTPSQPQATAAGDATVTRSPYTPDGVPTPSNER